MALGRHLLTSVTPALLWRYVAQAPDRLESGGGTVGRLERAVVPGRCFMTENTKELVVGLLGAAGVVVLLLGLLAETYEFMLGLVVAIGIWLVSGLFARYWGVPKWRLNRH